MAARRRISLKPRAPRLEIGRTLARVLCVALAAVGVLPFLAGALLKSGSVRSWAAREAAAFVERTVGVDASYAVAVQLLPLELVIENVTVRSSDGGAPAFTAKRIAVAPRLFSLLSGRIDAGEVEVEDPHARVVVRDGRLVNVTYRIPKSKTPAKPLERTPFTSLSLNDAVVSLDMDGVRVETGPLDLDVFAEPALAFEIALRAGESHVTRERTTKTGATAFDDDTLCELDARIRVQKGTALVRRLSLVGAIDDDEKPSTFGSCRGGETDPSRVLVRLSEVRMVLDDYKPALFDGHVVMRAPLSIANRFAKGPFRGWVGLVADARYDVHGVGLPEMRGKLKGGGIEMAAYRFAKDFDADVELVNDEVRVRSMHATYGHADVQIDGLTVKPRAPGVPLLIHRTDSRGLRWEDLMENIDVTNDTIVQWNLDKTVIADFGGTLSPLKLDGDLYGETTGFEVFDRSYRSPQRRHVIGVHSATIRTRFGVRPDGVQFENSRAQFGASDVTSSVVIGFHNDIALTVAKGSKIDLATVSPLVDIPMKGMAEVSAAMNGKASETPLFGQLHIDDFVFAGFPIGTIDSAGIRFQALAIDLSDVHGTKGGTRFIVPSGRLDFNAGATLLVDAHVVSDRFEVRDFFSMFHFDEDPRFDEVAGRGTVDARVHYDMRGPKDKCGTGYLRVDGGMDLSTLDLFGEHYDAGGARFDFRWMDQEAGDLGMQLDAPSVTLKKGGGAVLGSISLGDGAKVRAHFVASGIPIGRLDALGPIARGIDGQASAVLEASGTLDALSADVDGHIGPVRIGRATLPGSDVQVHLEPMVHPSRSSGKTRCGRPISPPFDPDEYARDASDGVFHVTGQLFGGAVAMNDLQITRQKHKTVRGDVRVKSLDLGALAELSPTAALADDRLEGRLTGAVSIGEFSTDRPGSATASVNLDEVRIGRRGLRVELAKPAQVVVNHGHVSVSGITLAAIVPTGEQAIFDVSGAIDGLGTAPRVDATLALRPTDLSAFARFLPQADRVNGTLGGSVHIGGGWPRLTERGKFTLEHGELALRGSPVTLTNVDVAIAVDPDELRIEKAHATVGGGTVDITGGAPIKGVSLGAARAAITARNVNLPITDGVRMAADADLELGWQPAENDDDRALPKLTGDVTVTSFKYTRKVTVAADIDSLTKRGHRTHFEAYDPSSDLLELEVRVRASRALEIDNDLVEAKLDVQEPGLVLSGTNQRFGMRGELDVVKGGRIRLRRNEFEITQGLVRFDDDERIEPRVDVTAVTDYHRYDDTLSSSSTPGPSTASGASGTGASGAAAGGQWRITMHAYGDPDTLRIDLSSEPALSQDDIFLLLTLGLTRAELDRAQSATAGGSVALEALGQLTGADNAVAETIPVIDEFKLGSAYSSRTGRTEPTVTIGKRLAQRIRAYVTSGLTESGEVRSNVELRLSPRVSVESSYDNVNDLSTTGLGNLGADVRWRLEFE